MNVPLPNSSAKNALSAFAASPKNIGPSTAPAFQPDLLRSIRMHPVLALSVALVSFALLLLHALTMRPVYESGAVISEQPESAVLPAGNLIAAFDSARYDSFLQEQIQTMQRPDTIGAALNKLPPDTWIEYGSSPQAATEGVLAHLKVGRISTSYQISLTLKGSNPTNVTAIINEIAASYLNSVHKQSRVERDEHARLLAEERHQIATELQAAEKDQNTLGSDLGIVNPSGETAGYDSELASLRMQLQEARIEHDAAAARLTSQKAHLAEQGSALTATADEALAGDTGLSALKSSINERRAVLYAQMSGMTDKNPLRQRGQDEMADLDHSLDEMTAKLRTRVERDLQDKLQADLQRTGYVEDRITALLSQRTAVATNATPKLQRAAEISDNIKRLLHRQAEVDDAIRSLELERNGSVPARLLFTAKVPTSPATSRQRLFAFASLPLALLLGLVAAVTARKCDPKIYTAIDVQNALGFAPLALLRAFNKTSGETVPEDVLRMAGALENAYRVTGVHSFLLTTASLNMTVLPLCRSLVEKLGHTGMSAYRTTPADLLLPSQQGLTEDPELVTPFGVGKSASSTKKGFVDANLDVLHAKHGLVLIEASTLTHCAETEYVARCANATIIVAEYAVTTKAELVKAASLLTHIGVTTVGVVVQNVGIQYLTNQEHRQLDTSHQAEIVNTIRLPHNEGNMPVSSSRAAKLGDDSQQLIRQTNSELARWIEVNEESAPTSLSNAHVLLGPSETSKNLQQAENKQKLPRVNSVLNPLGNFTKGHDRLDPSSLPATTVQHEDESHKSILQTDMSDLPFIPPVVMNRNMPPEIEANAEIVEFISDIELPLRDHFIVDLPQTTFNAIEQSTWDISSGFQRTTTSTSILESCILDKSLGTSTQCFGDDSWLKSASSLQGSRTGCKPDFTGSDRVEISAQHSQNAGHKLKETTQVKNRESVPYVAPTNCEPWNAPPLLRNKFKSNLVAVLHSANPESLDPRLPSSRACSEYICPENRQESPELCGNNDHLEKQGVLTRQWYLLSRFQQEAESLLYT